MAEVPDTRVRLSAEGLQEVLTAFRQIRAEAELTTKSAGQNWEIFNAVLEKGTQLLELFGLTAGVSGLVELVRHGAEAAGTLTDLAETAGLTTTQLEALFALAQKSGVGIEQFTRNIDFLQKKLDGLASGDTAAKDLFGRLGLTPQALKGKDLGQALDLISAKLAGLAAGEAKTTIASDLFGRSGARLIPVLQQLAGGGGLAAVTRAAVASGQALSGDVIAGAAQVNNELHAMQGIAGNLAITFASELGPALAGALGDAGNEMVNLQTAIHDMGPGLRGVVDLIDLLALGLIALGDRAVHVLNQIISPVFGLFAAAKGFFDNGFDGAEFALRKLDADLDEDDRKFKDRMEKRRLEQKRVWEDFVHPGNDTSTADGTTGGTRTAPPDPAKAARDRIALESALADNELKITLQLNKAQQDIEKHRFDDGLVSLQDYYSRRRFLIESAAAAEIATLTKRIETEKGNPDDAARRLATANLESQITLKTLQERADLAALDREEALEREKLALEQKKFDDAALDAEGKAHEARVRDIKDEAKELLKLDTKTGLPDDSVQNKNIFDRMQLLLAAENVRNQNELLSTEQTRLDTERAAIQREIDAGTISELDGKQQIAQLDAARIPELERIAQLAVDAAEQTGNQEKIAQAQQQLQRIRDMGQVATESQKLIVNFGQSAGQVLGDQLTNTLANAGTGFKSLGAAALATFANILQGLGQIEAKIIASRLIELLHLAPGAASFSGPSAADLTNPAFAASGGLITGPGTGTSDSIPARLSNREFVVRASAVAQPGMLPLLHMINQGVSIGSVLAAAAPDIANPVDPASVYSEALRQVRGYAEGGLVQFEGGGSSPALSGSATIEVISNEDSIIRVIESARGTKAMLNVVSKKPKAFGRALRRN